eukprot:5634518-Prorocentrum_lima.AAC.1
MNANAQSSTTSSSCHWHEENIWRADEDNHQDEQISKGPQSSRNTQKGNKLHHMAVNPRKAS